MKHPLFFLILLILKLILLPVNLEMVSALQLLFQNDYKIKQCSDIFFWRGLYLPKFCYVHGVQLWAYFNKKS